MVTEKPCERCGKDTVEFNTYCGARVCCECGHHKGFARCYCGWSVSGQDGRRELEELGETIDEDY
jgi:transposase InsO family protein